MEEITSYLPLHDREKAGIDGSDSDDEAVSACDLETFMDPEDAQISTNRSISFSQFIRKIIPLFQYGLWYLLPSFLLPRSREPRKLHPTAWLGR